MDSEMRFIGKHILLGGADLLALLAAGLRYASGWILRAEKCVRSVAEDDD